MKRSLKVSGLLSALSLSLFGVSVVGCSAEGTPNGEALGTTSQAHTFTPTGTGVPSDLQFMGEFKLNTSQVLIIGGYNASGTGQTTAGIINHGNSTWTRLVDGSANSNPLPTALGEVEIAQITASKYLVAGGRPSRDASATISAWILTLSGAGLTTAVWSRVNMGQARVIGKNNLLRCGSSGNRFIAIGGMTNGGMASTTTTTATDSVEVFNPATPGWSTLKISGTATVVTLPTNGKGYAQVLSPNVSKFIVAGGANSATPSALSDVQILTVNSTCQALSGSVTASNKINTSGTAMPSARARGASIQSNVTISGVVYDFIVATGNDTTRFGAAPPQRIFFYRSGTDAWSTTVRNLTTNGRVFGRLVQDDTTGTSVKMGTGVVPSGSALFNTTPTAVDLIDSAGVVSATTAMTNSRVGAAVQLFGNNDHAAFGTGYSAGTAAARTDVEDF